MKKEKEEGEERGWRVRVERRDGVGGLRKKVEEEDGDRTKREER
jgi:hypothetical protein